MWENRSHLDTGLHSRPIFGASLPHEPMSCTLAGFRQSAGIALDGCVTIDLGVPGAHFGNPFLKQPGLNANDCMKVAAHLGNATALRTLRLPGLSGIHHTWEQPGIGASGMRAIAAALPAGLEVLEITGHEIGDEGAAALASALQAKAGGRLRVLDLSLNSITNQGATAIAAAIGALPALERLNLEHNWVGTDGSTALAHALKAGASLRWLNLAGNNVGERGGVALAEALRTNTNLRVLNLYSNSLGTAGAVAFASVVASGTSGLAEPSLPDPRP